MHTLTPPNFIRIVPDRELVQMINDYWKLPVARIDTAGRINLALEYGVPRAARTTYYTHPCIVRVRRSGRNWLIVEK